MFYKIVNDGMILAISTHAIGEEISETEYFSIVEKLKSIPIAPSGYAYCLTDNLEWELCAIDKCENEKIGTDEALHIILGGAGV